jgi:nitroreductase
MPEPRQDVLDFLLTRRSRPAKTLKAPAPGPRELLPILMAAARTPDHGKLEPWRFIVLPGAALSRLSELVTTRGVEIGLDADKLEKNRRQFADAALVVAVVSSPTKSEKIPEIEQVLSAGAVCLGLLNAALASGWGANWLTGWMAQDRVFLQAGLGLGEGEFVAGFIEIGTESFAPPERPRPDMDKITTWVSQ